MVDERDTFRALVVDYMPVLSPQAVIVYMCYYSLCDENNVVDVTYSDLTEHLGIVSNTIKSVNDQLVEMGLIEIVTKDDKDSPECYSPNRKRLIKLMPARAFSTENRNQYFKKENRIINSAIREQALDIKRLPSGYQRLFNKKDLRLAFKKLGRDRFTVSNLIEHFGLDKEKVRLYLSNRKFKVQVVDKMKGIADEISGEIIQEELSEIIKKKEKKTYKTAEEMYALVMRADKDVSGNVIPIEKWRVLQLLRHFCILFEKSSNACYTVMPSKRDDPLKIKEMEDMSVVLKAFNDNPVEAVKYITWVFDNKESKLKDGIWGPGILRVPGMINEYKKKSSKPVSFKDKDSIDSLFIEWVKVNIPKIYEQHELDSMRDLYWIKEKYNTGDITEEVKGVIEEGIKRGIVPKEGNLVFKRG